MRAAAGSGALLVACALALLGCAASQPLSLEEAREVAITTTAQGFAPPPRSIGDITAILDQQKPDQARAEAMRRAAEAEPPPDTTGAALARFLIDRAVAAGELGRTKQAAADAAEAERILRAEGGDLANVLLVRSSLEIGSGRLRRAIELREERLQLNQRQIGRVLADNGILASFYARAGDFETAEARLAEAQRLLERAAVAAGGVRAPDAPPPQVAQAYWENWSFAVAEGRASVAEARGDLAEAEKYGREALRFRRLDLEKAALTPGGPPVVQRERIIDMVRLRLASVIAREGRLTEAEVEARQALLSRLQKVGRASTDTAAAVAILARIILDEGRLAEAETLARLAVDILESLGVDPTSSTLRRARAALGSVLVAQERWSDAAAVFDVVRATAENEPAARPLAIFGIEDAAIAWTMTSRAGQAVAVLNRLVAARQGRLGDKSELLAEARGLLGFAQAHAGQSQAALENLRAAVPVLLQRSRAGEEDAVPTMRALRNRLIFEAYMGALAGTQAGAAEAFRVADALRGQGIERAMAQSGARAAANDPALAELARQEQDARKQASALEALLADALSVPADQQDPAALARVRSEVDKLRAARSRLRAEIDRRFPKYAQLIDPRPATIEEARATLRPGEALVSLYLADDRSYVWAIPKEGPLSFAAVPLRRAEVERDVATLRQALDPKAETLAQIPAFDVGLAHRLYAALLAPVAPGWQAARSLLVVPHGALGELPFALLVTEAASAPADRPGEAMFASYRSVPFLVRKAAITQLPSVAALTTLRALPPGAASRRSFAGFGDPWFNQRQAREAHNESRAGEVQVAMATRGAIRLRAAPATETLGSATLSQLPRLPDTAEEVQQVALALKASPDADTFIGARASEHRVRTMNLADRRVIMFATHGLVPGDLDGLQQPALALSAPTVADDADGDGLLTMDKILGLKLDADWIVLSACNTASGDGAGAEAVSGLGRAFFYAGARSLLVTNWPVETTSARLLTTHVFRRQAEDAALSRAEALRGAMLDLIDGPGLTQGSRTLFSYAHPIFWAPFSLIGDGGG
jgi:CHAT domain-containing protein